MNVSETPADSRCFPNSLVLIRLRFIRYSQPSQKPNQVPIYK